MESNLEPIQSPQISPISDDNNLDGKFTKLNERFVSMGKFIVQLQKKLDAANNVMSSEQQDKIFEALSKAKGSLAISMEKTGAHNRGDFATYPDLVNHARICLAENGLDIIHEIVTQNELDYLKTTIIHSSGQWRSSIVAIQPEYGKGMSNSQAYTGAITTMKRIVYAAILNLHTGGEKE